MMLHFVRLGFQGVGLFLDFVRGVVLSRKRRVCNSVKVARTAFEGAPAKRGQVTKRAMILWFCGWVPAKYPQTIHKFHPQIQKYVFSQYFGFVDGYSREIKIPWPPL